MANPASDVNAVKSASSLAALSAQALTEEKTINEKLSGRVQEVARDCFEREDGWLEVASRDDSVSPVFSDGSVVLVASSAEKEVKIEEDVVVEAAVEGVVATAAGSTETIAEEGETTEAVTAAIAAVIIKGVKRELEEKAMMGTLSSSAEVSPVSVGSENHTPTVQTADDHALELVSAKQTKKEKLEGQLKTLEKEELKMKKELARIQEQHIKLETEKVKYPLTGGKKHRQRMQAKRRSLEVQISSFLSQKVSIERSLAVIETEKITITRQL